jgi:hypothetical protein
MAKGDLKDQLGSFVKGALAQLETVREVVVQKSRVGKIQLDVAMMRRRRKEILAELGEAVAKLAADGRVSEEDFPELSSSLAQLDAIDEKIAIEEERARRLDASADAATSPASDEAVAETEAETDAETETAAAAETEAKAEADKAEEPAETDAKSSPDDLDSGSRNS